MLTLRPDECDTQPITFYSLLLSSTSFSSSSSSSPFPFPVARIINTRRRRRRRRRTSMHTLWYACDIYSYHTYEIYHTLRAEAQQIWVCRSTNGIGRLHANAMRTILMRTTYVGIFSRLCLCVCVERAANGFYRLHRQLFCLSHKINKFKIVRHTRTAYETHKPATITHPSIHPSIHTRRCRCVCIAVYRRFVMKDETKLIYGLCQCHIAVSCFLCIPLFSFVPECGSCVCVCVARF